MPGSFLLMSAKMCCKTSPDNEKNSFVMKHLMSICNTSLVVKDAVLHISHNDSYDLLRNMSSY